MEDPQVVYLTVLDNDPQVIVQEPLLREPQQLQPLHPPHHPLPPPLLPRPPPLPAPRPVSPSPVQSQGEQHARQMRLTKRETVLITAVVIFAILSLIFCVLFFTTECSTTKKSNESSKAGKSCADHYKKGFRTDGVYTVDPDGAGTFKVRCDMTTSGGGWTIFQRRLNGSVDFYRGWQDYKNGFGNLKGEFWLGLDRINRLTRSQEMVLRIDMEDTAGNTKYAEYSSFAVASEKFKYELGLGTYSGTAGDSFTYSKGRPFSTKDSDNDPWHGVNCAIEHKGAWWYNKCRSAN